MVYNASHSKRIYWDINVKRFAAGATHWKQNSLCLKYFSILRKKKYSFQPVLGTNPLSFAAPANSCDSFVLDMPTSTIKPLNWAQHRIEKQPIYSKPAGGSKTISDHKEDGLGTMVEVLCAVLSGSNLSSEVPPSTSKCDVEANLGQLFIVINPNCFNLGFNSRLSELNKMLRCLLPVKLQNYL